MPAEVLTVRSDYKVVFSVEEMVSFGPGWLGTKMCPRDGASGGIRLRGKTMRLFL